MSKKTEKESENKNQNKPEIEKKKVDKEVSEKKHSQEPTQIEDKDAELKNLKEEINDLKNDKLRLAAELKNEQKDFQRQMEQVYKYSNKRLVSWVLNFLVDLEEKALKAMRSNPEDKVKNHLLGIEMMRNILWKGLENEGVKEIKIEVGKDGWSSRLHELVEEVENENFPLGTVIEVSEKGYLLADQILRPAKVIISKKTEKEKTNK